MQPAPKARPASGGVAVPRLIPAVGVPRLIPAEAAEAPEEQAPEELVPKQPQTAPPAALAKKRDLSAMLDKVGVYPKAKRSLAGLAGPLKS